MKIAIIGAGLIGRKRALALPKGITIKTICNRGEAKGRAFAKEFNCEYIKDWKKTVDDKEIKAVIIATDHQSLSPIAIRAISNGKHVLIEKPGARNLKELKMIYKAHKKHKVVVVFGYNHRYHPAIQKAKQLVDSRKYGQVLFIRARYGHGGRLGYEKEWRFKKSISGGGELMDQGSHLIDLTNFFAGKMDKVKGVTKRFFWRAKVEDTALFILSNKNQVAYLSASWVEWKNIFSFEIMLKTAKLQIDGLGGSYGQEILTLYEMKPQMGPPDVKKFIFPQEDKSWTIENKLFFDRIKKRDYNDQSLKDALYVLETVNKLYKQK